MKRILLLLSALLLSACIQVRDFGEYWGLAQRDACLTAIGKKLTEGEREDRASKADARLLHVAGEPFLLLKYARADKGGDLIRIRFEEGKRSRAIRPYMLREEKKKPFMKAFPHSGAAFDDHTVTIAKLDGWRMNILSKLVRDRGYWQPSGETLEYGSIPACKNRYYK